MVATQTRNLSGGPAVNTKLKSTLAAVTAFFAITMISAKAQDVRDRTFKLAFVNVQDTAHDLRAKRFAEIVSQKSGGKLQVRLYPGGSLGGEAVAAPALQGGKIEMSFSAPGF